jgi:hypothetical protein
MAALLGSPVGAATAQVVDIATFADDGAEPKVTATETADRFVAGWQQNGSIYARGVNAGMLEASASLFTRRSDYRWRTTYDQPALAWVRGQRRVLAAGRRLDEREIVTPSDRFWIPEGQAIEVATFDEALRPLARRVLDPRGGGLSGGLVESMPAVAADEFGSFCCVLVAFEASHTRGLELQRLGSGLELIAGGASSLAPGSGETLMNPALVYQRFNDVFLLVYETETEIRARRVPALSGFAGPEQRLAIKRTPARPGTRGEAHPSVAYASAANRFLVAYRDDNGVHGIYLDRDGVPIGTAFPIRGPSSCTPLCTFDAVSLDAPAVAAFDGGRAFLAAVDRRGMFAPGDASALATFRVQPPRTGPSFDWSWVTTYADGPSWQPQLAFDAASGQAFAVFEVGSRVRGVRFRP